ncbi:MAG TPA: cysteine desulfurase family protein [Aestuariivirgaceae bacterium]|nr:cysteine desulfurase family protein [Aestuariivirgaceae bacterium]
MDSTRTYLDHNASSPLRPEARQAMLEALDAGGNASSVHGEGRAARNLIESAREELARSLGVPPRSVVFTSGGTEANALALRGSGAERLIVSAVEHASVRAAAEQSGRAVDQFTVDSDGIVDLACLARSLAAGPKNALVSLMLANNETGAIQPVAEAAELTHRHGAIIHCDAAQAVGRMAVDWQGLGVDLMTLSAHKFGGPQGVGALLIRPGTSMLPLIGGGGQEFHLRGGTENVAAICGMAAAFRSALGDDADSMAAGRNRLESRLKAVSPALRIFAEGVRRLPNTSCFALEGLLAETAVMAFDLLGVAVSSGSACSSGKVGRSHVLEAMGVPAGLARSAVRVSLGWNTTERDLTRLVEAWRELVSRPAARSAA